MKKISLLVVLCMILLCGCSSYTAPDDTQIGIVPQESSETADGTESDTDLQITTDTETESLENADVAESLVGIWGHKDYPDNYMLLIKSGDNNSLNIELIALKGKNASRVARAGADGVQFVDNVIEFYYDDSFGNTGICRLVIDGEEITVSYVTDQPYKGGWCVDAGEGTYVKTENPSENAQVFYNQ